MRGSVVAALCLVALGWPLAGCQRDVPQEARLLVLDGMTIMLAEVEPYVAFLDSSMPEFSRTTKVKTVLDEYLIPMHLARREFADARAAQLRTLTELRSVATNAYELEQQSTNRTSKERSKAPRSRLRLPVAMFLFDPAKMGSVSEPIELPNGYVLATAFDLKESQLAIDDRVDCLQVGAFTHPHVEFMAWYRGQEATLGQRASFVHPDYRDAIPTWIQTPKQP